MPSFSSRVLVFTLASLIGGAAGAAAPESPSQGSPPASSRMPATPAPSAAATQRVSAEMKFVEPSGATLAERRIDLTLGKTETVSIPKGGRTVSAEITVTGGTKAGCHHVDITLRDKTIDSTGHFNKTTWQSASDPCGSDPITFGPKEETRLQLGIKPAS